jgi:uncharacterized 2Fe-2S/4Fe-4S cluster protein (DUF4445 family)
LVGLMSSVEVRIEPDGLQVEASEGELLLDIALGAGIPMLAECGGRGECGSCAVEVQSGRVRLLNRGGTEEDITAPTTMLACQTETAGDVVMTIPEKARLEPPDSSISGYIHPAALQFVKPRRKGFPLAQRVCVQMDPPSFDDPTCDWERLVQGLQAAQLQDRQLTASLEQLREIPDVLRDNDFEVSAAVVDTGCHHEVVDVGPTKQPPTLGLAVDIGTSNVKAELVDLQTGKILAGGSALNAQVRYGEDVISRIIYTQDHEDGARRLQDAITDTVNGLIEQFLDETGCRAEQIIAIACSGNATMISLRLQIPPDTIRRAPHIAPVCQPPTLCGKGLGLHTHPRAAVFCLPAINGYVGGDISAGILSTGMFQADELTLLIDVGTNGEIVLGSRDWMTCCSCSAGPAFEGMGIQCGLPARPGAIDSLHYDPDTDEVSYHTIGDQPALGLCGNGFVETLASLLEGGIIDRAGNLDATSDLARMRQVEGEWQFVLVWEKEAATDHDIVLRQTEIDNLIRAKAAVYAGVSTLLTQLGMEMDSIQRLYLAGAFGQHLDISAAIKIGLLPEVGEQRVTVAGNTALTGTYLSLLSSQVRRQVLETAMSTTYVDLSTSDRFMEEFVSAQMLPHTDVERFSSVAGSVGHQ